MENIISNTKKITILERAKQIAQIIQIDNPDYYYLKELFKKLRKELEIKRALEPKKLPYVPTTEEIKRYYDVVWNNQNTKHMIIVKMLLYTGIKISELVKIKLEDVKLAKCVIHIKKDENDKKVRIVVEHAYSHKRLCFVVHLCTWLSGEPQPLASQQVRWVRPEQLGEYPFPAANAQIIAALLAAAPSFAAAS